ncbi:pyridoxamine 5'-phosphate oxidase family protein [Dysgonomonas sp. Marseille-P4361]|uniref:pyridoxamine 5'-phosphate oxidase family protein n=1 Tax=Dysgonomonas sp. Marseille-P4361 TaxID=2161820 RepID=UPI000D55FF74|nr:pyridoxamine 5'-phosphate oxidase family protein [Dysgonomonas sp. Marseille-P4361]
MRRKDREMNQEFAIGLIDKSPFGVLSIIDMDGQPYGIPLSLVRDDKFLYFHSAKGGKKADSLSNGQSVWVTFVGTVDVPDLFSEEELQSFLTNESKASTLSSKVFTTEYESAMILGKIYLVKEETESINALRLLCEKYTPSKMPYFDLAVKEGLPKTNIYRIDIEEITSKRKKFDSSGEEMKWGRIE